MSKILITGWPKTGKSYLADEMGVGVLVRSTDETVDRGLSWSDASAEVATWLDAPGPWIIEGVSIPRALRKWAIGHDGAAPPVDEIIFLRNRPRVGLNEGQIRMGKGLDTVWREIEPWLKARNVKITYRD